jgi:triphosphatase
MPPDEADFSMIEGREVELKLELSREDVARFAELPELGGRLSRPVRQISVYFDTPKDDLRKAGFSLRVRRVRGRSVQTLKLDEGAGLFSRAEWEWKVTGPEPDLSLLEATPAGPLLRSTRLSKRIGPRFEIRVRRRSRTVRRGKSEIEVVLDEGEAVCGELAAPIREVELELKSGREAALFDLARELGGKVPLRLGVRSKAERGYALVRPSRRRGRAVKAEPLALGPDMAVADAFAAIVHACLRHFRLNEPWVERKRDPGALHQSRVAMRRLRSAMTLFRPVVRDEHYDRLRDELRWLTGQLGEARNIDVFSARMSKRRGGKGSKVEAAFRASLAGARASAYDRVVEALGSARLRALIIDLLAWVEAGLWRSGAKAKRPLEAFAEKQLSKRWKRVRRAGARLRFLEAEPLHRLRIDIKKLRYASEFFSGLAASEEEATRRESSVAAMEELQDELGAINDMATARDLISHLPLVTRAEQSYAERLAARGDGREKHIATAEPAFARLAALAEGHPY